MIAGLVLMTAQAANVSVEFCAEADTNFADVAGGDYFGPKDFFQTRGAPKRVGRTSAAKDQAVAAKLWTLSEALTGVHYPTSVPNSSTS